MAFYLKIINFGRLSFMLDKMKNWGVLKIAWTEVFKTVIGKYGSLKI